MVTASELAAMRSAINDLLPDTAYILTPTQTVDSQGNPVTSWGTTGTSVCRLDVIQGREMLSGGAVQPFTSHMVSLPYDTTVVSTNRLSIGGTQYNVRSINAGQSWSAVKRVEVERA